MLEGKVIMQYNSAGQRHGYWESYWANETLMYKGNYLNDVPHGYWEWYNLDGTLNYKRFYARM